MAGMAGTTGLLYGNIPTLLPGSRTFILWQPITYYSDIRACLSYNSRYRAYSNTSKYGSRIKVGGVLDRQDLQ
jgi:hypothetical protein